jgi:DNA polymerase/3'-5' exonuclease PolX
MGIGKIDLSEARIIADKILNHISPAMSRIEIAGSIRREKPVVGDIELVAIVADQEKLIKMIGDIGQTIKPGVPGLVPWSPKPDAKYIRVRLNEEMNLDLFVARPENWGGLYLMRTGSAAGADGNAFNGFVPGIFSRFKKLSGGGRMTDVMPTMPDGTQLPVYEEQDFFDLLEMDFVPPVERTGRNVIKKYIKVEA